MLTIIIPSYNHQDYILQCLNSVINIPVSEKKIIIIDDGSTDNTPSIIRKFIAHNGSHDIKLIEKENSGLVHSLNLGLSLVNTKYTYIVASDDIPIPNGIIQLIEIMEANENLFFIIGGANNFFPNGNINDTYTKAHDEFFSLPTKERNIDIFLNYPTPLLIQSTLFKTSALISIDGWDENITLDDYPTFIKLLNNYYRYKHDFDFLPQIKTIMYRHHGENSYKHNNRQFLMVQQVLNKYCPKEILTEAISKKTAYYLTACIQDKNLDNFFFIVKKIKPFFLPITFYFLIKFLFYKALNFFKKLIINNIFI